MTKKPNVAVSVKLTKSESMALRRLAFRARRAGGRKLPSAAIIRALVRMMMDLDVTLEGVESVEELKRRLLEARTRK